MGCDCRGSPQPHSPTPVVIERGKDKRSQRNTSGLNSPENATGSIRFPRTINKLLFPHYQLASDHSRFLPPAPLRIAAPLRRLLNWPHTYHFRNLAGPLQRRTYTHTAITRVTCGHPSPSPLDAVRGEELYVLRGRGWPVISATLYYCMRLMWSLGSARGWTQYRTGMIHYGTALSRAAPSSDATADGAV